MLKLIVGTKGSGKTKTMIDMIDKAVKTTSGNIVVIEKCMKLTTEINHSARLVDVDEYGIVGADMLYGFVAGMLAGNYDITELFLDGILRITDHDMAAAAKVLNAIDKITSGRSAASAETVTTTSMLGVILSMASSTLAAAAMSWSMMRRMPSMNSSVMS